MAKHVRVNRKTEASAGPNALDQPIDGVGRERPAALGGEHKGRISAAPSRPRPVLVERLDGSPQLHFRQFAARLIRYTEPVQQAYDRRHLLIRRTRPRSRMSIIR
jgi:hypothetical protein